MSSRQISEGQRGLEREGAIYIEWLGMAFLIKWAFKQRPTLGKGMSHIIT